VGDLSFAARIMAQRRQHRRQRMIADLLPAAFDIGPFARDAAGLCQCVQMIHPCPFHCAPPRASGCLTILASNPTGDPAMNTIVRPFA
jgi:hypothetical protein